MTIRAPQDAPATLRRRLASYFDRIPHLAYVGVDSWSGHARLLFALDLDLAEVDADHYLSAESEAERLLARLARLLGARRLVCHDPTWGPRGNEHMIYVRDPFHPCWRRWIERMEDARVFFAARATKP